MSSAITGIIALAIIFLLTIILGFYIQITAVSTRIDEIQKKLAKKEN